MNVREKLDASNKHHEEVRRPILRGIVTDLGFRSAVDTRVYRAENNGRLGGVL